MKIVTVAYLHGSGGAERQIIMLSNALAEKGYDIHLIVLSENKSHYYIDGKVKLHDLSQKETGKLHILKRWYYLWKELKQIKPDLCINYNFQSVYFEVVMPVKVRGKIVYSERGDPYDKEYSGILGILRTISFRFTDGFVFQSEGARDFFGKTIRERSAIIHNPVSVPLGKYQIPQRRDKRIVSVGRLHEQKNQKLLIEAFSIVHKSHPNYILEIYGDGKLRNDLQHKINQLSLNEFVYLIPSVNNIFDRIVNASLFVLTSDYEGMPNALMEALALGIPCISTDCRPGGARTLIKNGQNGYIVPKGNKEELKDKINFVLDNPNKAEELARNGQEILYTHTPDMIFDKWDSFITKLLSSKNE